MSESRGFAGPWLALSFALALHIADEALTGFLGIYNPTVVAMRQRWSWFPMPTFEFREWLAGLIVVCVITFFLTPLADRDSRILRTLAWFYAVIMLLNGFGHTLFTILGRTVPSVLFSRPAPGFYSSPFLLAASVWMIVRLWTTRDELKT